MRDILFRGKRRDNRKWYYGSYLYLKDAPSYDWAGKEVGSREDVHYIIDDKDINYAVNQETICQYTGLKDKNGKKIFEGDICKDGDNIVRILWNDKHQWGVEISKTNCALSKGLISPLWQYDNCEQNGNRELEVIGNIFDNPELIQK